jgi:hypothetical protein
MEDELIGIDTVLRQSADVLVVREQDDLSAAGEIRQSLEGGRGAFIIELDQDIINDKRNRLVALEVGFQAGEPKG